MGIWAPIGKEKHEHFIYLLSHPLRRYGRGPRHRLCGPERGGMMMLLSLTSVLGCELKTAVGTSVFIMTFTALTVSGQKEMPVRQMPDRHF